MTTGYSDSTDSIMRRATPNITHYRSGEALTKALDSLTDIESINLEQTLSTLTPDSGQREYFLQTALQKASSKGLANTMHLLLQNGGTQFINQADDFGNTLLIMAAVNNHTDVLSLLLEAGANVNSVDMNSRTALHWVALNGDAEGAGKLLRHGALPDLTDNTYNFTPLMLSARQGYTDIVRLLLKHNCDVTRRDNHGETPLFDAVRNNNIDCMELLLVAGARVDSLDSEQRSSLSMAIAYNRPEAMRRLIAWNCDIDIRAVGGIPHLRTIIRYSPLDISAMEGLEDQCNMLVMAGADTRCLRHRLTMRSDNMFLNGESVKKWITGVLERGPRSLKELSRIYIRKFYAGSFPHILNNLPLPKLLKIYLTVPQVTNVCDCEEMRICGDLNDKFEDNCKLPFFIKELIH